jgi:hypothetical protein
VQGWICKPPGFDPTQKYPMILEIHGGPFANYGDRFSAEVQLYAAAGCVVRYVNNQCLKQFLREGRVFVCPKVARYYSLPLKCESCNSFEKFCNSYLSKELLFCTNLKI